MPTLVKYGVFLFLVTLLVKPLGRYLAHVFSGKPTFLDPVMGPVERFIYKAAGVNTQVEMTWRAYASAFLTFGLVGTVLLYVLLRVQYLLPWYDPAQVPTPMTADLAFNTAVNFVTTTTWQAYAGETTMSYWSQLVGLVVQNFVAGASGLAVGLAFIRGLARERSDTLGNFWVDTVRGLLRVLLPLSIVLAVVLVFEGVPMNFAPYTSVETLEAGTQTIAQGPVAALESIKNLGTNGGGFFNTNGAHPYENPTPLTNFLEMLAIVALPASLTYTFGLMTNRVRDGWLLYKVMAVLFAAGLFACVCFEQSGTAALSNAFASAESTARSEAIPNLEGKEVRFGVDDSVLTAVVTSNGATGSYNSMHDSYAPLGGAVLLVNMLLGEIVFGGLGTGLSSIVLTAIVGLFLAGLMIGRKPEYIGKEIGIREMQFTMLYTLSAPVFVLGLTAIAVVAAPGLAGLTTNTGAHGFTEIFFAYTSSFANNGQNFAGLSANSVFYNVTTAIAMFAGRFGLAIPALALAGSFARQGRRPVTAGTLPTHSAGFGGVVVATALLVGVLSYCPALVVGPVFEHLTSTAPLDR